MIFFTLLYASLHGFGCTSLEELTIYCKARCDFKGNKSFWVKNDQCNCGDPEVDLTKAVFKVRSNKLNGKVIIDPKPRWDEE